MTNNFPAIEWLSSDLQNLILICRLNLQSMPLFIIDIFPVMLIMGVFNSSDYDDYDVCAQRVQTKPCVHQDHQKGKVTLQETEPDLPECLSVSCGDTGQQGPAAGTGALAAAGLRGAACGIDPLEEVTVSHTIQPPSRQPTN